MMEMQQPITSKALLFKIGFRHGMSGVYGAYSWGFMIAMAIKLIVTFILLVGVLRLVNILG